MLVKNWHIVGYLLTLMWVGGRLILLKENCHNSRTSDDIDMKLGPVTILDKRNKTMLKNITETSYG